MRVPLVIEDRVFPEQIVTFLGNVRDQFPLLAGKRKRHPETVGGHVSQF